MLGYIVSTVFWVGIAATAVVQGSVFVKDIIFYRKAGWDLSLDSGNDLLFFEPMKKSMIFFRFPIGLLRLIAGACFVGLGVVGVYALYFLIFGYKLT